MVMVGKKRRRKMRSGGDGGLIAQGSGMGGREREARLELTGRETSQVESGETYNGMEWKKVSEICNCRGRGYL